jgi:galactonate dehydratase
MSLGIHYNTNVGVDLKAYTKNPEAFDVQEGMVKVSDLPGLGIEIDEEAVRAAAVGAEAWTQPYFVDLVTGELREW